MSKPCALQILLLLSLASGQVLSADIDGLGPNFTALYAEIQSLEAKLPYLANQTHFTPVKNAYLVPEGNSTRQLDIEEFKEFLVKDIHLQDDEEQEAIKKIVAKIEATKLEYPADIYPPGTPLKSFVYLFHLLDAVRADRSINYSHFSKHFIKFRATLTKDSSTKDRDAIFNFARPLKDRKVDKEIIAAYVQKLREGYAIQIGRSNSSKTLLAELNAKLRLAASILDVAQTSARNDRSEFAVVTTDHEGLASTKIDIDADYPYMSTYRNLVSTELKAGWVIGSYKHYAQTALIALPIQRFKRSLETAFPGIQILKEYSEEIQSEWHEYRNDALLEILSVNRNYRRETPSYKDQNLEAYIEYLLNNRAVHTEMLAPSLASFFYAYFNYSNNGPGLKSETLIIRDPKEIQEMVIFLQNWRNFELTQFDTLYANPKRHDDVLHRIARLKNIVHGD